jgi:hypothetical protein
MSLNNIKLQEFIVTEWYSDNLLPSRKSAVASIASKPTATASPAGPNSNYGEFAAISPISPNTTPPPSAPALQPPAPQASTPTTQTSVPSPLKSLGSNRRHVTILVSARDSPFLPDNQLAFLTKILEACRLSLADVAIVNNATAETNITTIKEQLAPKTILLFGLEPSALRLPINFPPFKPLDYDGCTYLSTPGLDQLVRNTEESKLLKSKLWICLRTIFDV